MRGALLRYGDDAGLVSTAAKKRPQAKNGLGDDEDEKSI
jgi:hypothetical protein